jgi:prephenate dehydrogenase
MTIQITVLGLGQVGISIGLALAAHKDKITRVGNDREPEVTRRVARMGAFDQLPYNLPKAVEQADVVVLALPVDEIRSTLEIIAPDLKPGTVVVDTSPLQVKTLEWARDLIPAERFLVSMTPIVAAAYLEQGAAPGPESAKADLFKDSLVVITSPPGVDPAALKLASDLAILLGAKLFFADLYEADGLLAAVHLLPRLAAAALVNATASQTGWSEARKLAGRAYAAATSPVDELDERKTAGLSALYNRDNSLRVIDNLVYELEELRRLIAEGDETGLAERMEQARTRRAAWMGQRRTGTYDDPLAAEMPTPGQVLGRLVGLGRNKKK